MKVKTSKRRSLYNLVAVVLVLLVTAFISLQITKPNPTVAAAENQIEIKISKVTTVSIYAFGSGVELVSSTSNHDIYTAEVGTTVRLQAVNETRIFTSWVITKQVEDNQTTLPEIADKTQSIINFVVTETMADLDVTVNRENAKAEDYGKYMMDRFVIVNETELIALQDILAGSMLDSDYAKFYKDPNSYSTAEKKATLRTDLQNGYFLIANNFTVFNEKFRGLGTASFPFQGVMCGKNTNNSKLFITITGKEQEGTSSYGLFSYLGEKAVIRNLIVSTTIGIDKNVVDGDNNTIYAGGLAGVMDKSTLVDVVVSTSIGINSVSTKNIYAGGLAGVTTAGTGIDSISDVVYDGTEAKWSITSSKEDAVVSAGLVAGMATDTYIKEVDLNVTNQLIDLKNDSTNDYTNSKLYLGNIFGSYNVNTRNITIDDIMIMGNKGESLRAITTNGDAMVGGLIGYVNSNGSGSLNLGKTFFRAMGSENIYEASTINTSSVGNVYVGGVLGYIDGTKVKALDSFKNRLEVIMVNESSITEANYLFMGDYQIRAVQNGTSNETTNGKAIAGGVVGKGILDLNGTSSITDMTELALCSPDNDSSLLIEAIQSKLTATVGTINDKEHACAALVYGSVGDTNVTMQNISVFSNNTTVQTIREIGTKATGDLHSGGFISYAKGSTFTDINLYLNNCAILAESLSYEGKNILDDTNSAFCGGFAGELLGNSNLTNFKFAGYDINTFYRTDYGTTSYLESIQNTIPGGDNYRGENYIGGIVGRIQYAKLENCKFIGSDTNKDYIRMNGHESPDSAFCGGIVGLIRTSQNDVPSSIINCEVINTEVIGNATCVINYSDPDIYVGGIVGAAYMHATNSIINISGCRLTNSSVYALGNEIMSAYAGGIIGGATWESQINIKDCYVYESSISATTATTVSTNKELEASAAGILGGMKTDSPKNDGTTISNCAVIDSEVNGEVDANHTNIKTYAAGILGFRASTTTAHLQITRVINCYSNAVVKANHKNASGTANAYGIAYAASFPTETKTVTTEVTRTLYQNFEYNNYSFRVVNQVNGTYNIYNNTTGKYVNISWWGRISEGNNPDTTYTYNNGHLSYNNRYINFSDNSISIVTNTNNAYNFSSIINTTNETYKDQTNVACNNSYFLKKNVNNPVDTIVPNNGQKPTAIATGPFNIPKDTSTNPYLGYDYLYGFDGVGQKLYIELIGDKNGFSVTNTLNEVPGITSTLDNSMVLAHIWVNAKTNGGVDGNNNLIIPDHENKEEAAKNGWFILDYVMLYTGELADISSDLSDVDIYYTNGVSKYKYHLDDTDSENPLHYVENVNNAEDRIKNNYIEVYRSAIENTGIANKHVQEFTFKVYDDMLSLGVDLNITHFGANYKLVFIASDQETIIDDAEFRSLYGDIEFKLIEKHYQETSYDRYHLSYAPNEEIKENASFYILFVGGNNLNTSKTVFKVNLEPNKLQLAGLTYADYTPPLNYFEENSGTEKNPYKLYVGSTTKFIPVFTKSNDIVSGTKYVLEEYIEECNYAINNNNFDMKANGELIASSTVGDEGTLTITLKDNASRALESVTVHYKTTNDIKVNYSSVGSDIDGLTHAGSTVDFYFEQTIRSNYSGIPNYFNITIGQTLYDLTQDPDANEKIKIYEIDESGNVSNTPITEFRANATGYAVKVEQSLLESIDVVNINIAYPIVYTITFKLQCETFNELPEEDLTKTFKVVGGTSFATFFESKSEIDPDKTIKQEIDGWTKNAEVFGFVFTGFYLVNDANSIHSYGVSFEDLLKSNYTVNASNTFYGRWSYLVELIEAPGTAIKTGFNSSFMYNYGEKEAGFNREIQIPINANQGYLFRVDKDASYIGEVDIEAYVITKNGDNKVKTEVPVEYYQGNKNLYFIRPENITGYLVVKTNVGNSEVIVGEHTSSVTENITPEDGIITFKYVVNHYNKDGDQSYIYNLIDKNGNPVDYRTLEKEFVLDFFKVSDHSDLKLPDFTEIRVYYNTYLGTSTTPDFSLVGTYITHNDDRVFLSEFKLLDLETDFMKANKTFADTLEHHEQITEVLYFTITPPNGNTGKVQNEIANYVVECGYCYGQPTGHGEIEYLRGVRTKKELANEGDLADIITGNENVESAKQDKVYQVTPTRKTELGVRDNIYTFIDDKTYSVYDITLTDTQKLPDFHYISLYDAAQNSILESSIMKFPIRELRVSLGYRLGNVKIYGKISEEAEWEEVKTINVTSAVYQEYVVDFKKDGVYPYHAYKIDNISTNEIRVSQLDVLSASNGVLYAGPITHFEEKSIVDNQYTYSLINQIVGDSRHDGKTFMLAIQLEDESGNIINDIEGNIYIVVRDIGLGQNHYVYLNEHLGKGVAYINLTKILKTLNVNTINFEIHVPDTPDKTTIYSARVLEVTNEYKPAQGEARFIFTNLHKHTYTDGVCSCGHIDVDYHPEVSNPILETIQLACFDNSGLVSGNTHSDAININYLCDKGVLPHNKLIYQQKILLKEVDNFDGVYEIVAVSSDIHQSADELATLKSVTWTHAIATEFIADYESKYTQYLNHYLIIEGELTKTTYTGGTLTFTSIYESIVAGTYDGYTNAYIYKDINSNKSNMYYDLSGGEWNNNAPTGKEYGDLYASTVAENSTITLPTPKKYGQRFLGWYEAGQKVNNSFTARDCLLVARWEDAVYDNVSPSNLASVLATAEEGATIKLTSGTSTSNVTINKSIKLLGAQAGVNPNDGTRTNSGKETTFTGDLTIAANDVVVDGIRLNGNGKVVGQTNGVSNVTITNLLVQGSTTNPNFDSSKNAPLYFWSTGNIWNHNIVIDQVRMERTSGRAMAFYGNNINCLTITNSEFYGTNNTTYYNDAIKIGGENSDEYGIKGDVKIINNYFKNYHQYAIWFLKYDAGNYDILNNTFTECGRNTTTYNYAAVRFKDRASTAGMVNASVSYNTIDNEYILLVIDEHNNTISSNSNFKANCNKFTLYTSTYVSNYYLENNDGDFEIDGRYNYYSTSNPNSAKFKNTVWDSYYTNINDVPVYPNA